MTLNTLRTWIAAAAVAVAGPAAAYSDMFVFGDSLSDSGNIALLIGTDPGQVITGNTYVPSMPYASGTFSNGPTWAALTAGALGVNGAPSLIGGGNYAFGGARTSGGSSPSLLTQLGMYFGDSGGTASDDALYVIAGGGNNARTAFESIVLGGARPNLTIAAAAAQFAKDIGGMVDALQAAGADDIVVWTVPDLGSSPALTALGPQASALATAISMRMNQALARELNGEGVTIFNTFELLSDVRADPAAYGLSNISDACGAPSNGCDPATALFWDGIHPTAMGQQIIAQAMIAAVVPEPGTWALFAAGGLFLLARRRRD